MTPAVDPFARLLQEVAGLDDRIVRIDQSDVDAFEFSYADGTQVLLERREARGDFLLDVSLGEADPLGRLAIYELMLNQNLAWRGDGALRLGLAGQDGDIVLSASVPSDRLHLASLHAALQEFLRLAQAWREIVANSTGTIRSAAATTPTMDPFGWA